MLARLATLLLVLLAALALAACGGDDSEPADEGGGDTTAETAADDGADEGEDGTADGGKTIELGVKPGTLEFDKTELQAEAGTVTIRFTNPDQVPHNVAIEKDGETLEEGELISGGEVSEVTVELEPGEYTYYCTPHKEAGMTGTLTVT